MNNNLEFAEKDIYAKFLGVEFIYVDQGAAKAKMVIGPNHLNSMETVHGGAVFSLGDAVFAAASNSRDGQAVAINVSISYFKPVCQGELVAEAQEVSISKKLATYLVRIEDEDKNEIALFQGTVYRKNT